MKTSKIAICILAVLFGNFTGVECSDYLTKLEAEVVDLQEAVAKAREEQGSAPSIAENIKTATAEIDETIAGLNETEQRIADKEFLLRAYQSGFRVISSIDSGHALGAVSHNGQTLSNCVFLNARAGAIHIQSSAGQVSIPLSEIPASLKQHFSLPDSTSNPTSNFEAIYAAKPDLLKTEEEKEKSQSVAIAEENSTAGVQEATETKKTDAQIEAEKAQERNKARLKAIEALRQQYAEVYASRKKEMKEKSKKNMELRSRKIRQSQAQIDASLTPYDRKISRLEEQEAEIKKKMALIKSQIE